MATTARETAAVPRSRHSARYDVLVGSGLVSLVLLAVGGWLTSLGIGPWYYELSFPPFQPPAWVFTPAWIVVLSLLALATWKVSQGDHSARIVFALYGAQCVLNAGWSLLFFTLQRPDAALYWLFVLDATLLLMVICYARASRLSGLLLVPYLLWLLFATAINSWIVKDNGPFSPQRFEPSLVREHLEDSMLTSYRLGESSFNSTTRLPPGRD